MPSLSYSVIDAFTREPFQGNPAAVVEGGDELSDDQVQRIAREFNLSETVFLLRPTGAGLKPAVRLRWFTPACEVSFCGHATLAAIHTFCERASELPTEVGVECAAGNLTMNVDSSSSAGRCYWLSMPDPQLHPAAVPIDKLLAALCVPRTSKQIGQTFETRDHDVIVFLDNGRDLRALAPDMSALDQLSRQHNIRGVSVASTDTTDPDVTCISRFFAPAAGIAEDPVTGSVHGPLAALLIREQRALAATPNHWSFVCRQVPANGRVGTVHVRAESHAGDLSIEIGGSCVTVMGGQLSF